MAPKIPRDISLYPLLPIGLDWEVFVGEEGHLRIEGEILKALWQSRTVLAIVEGCERHNCADHDRMTIWGICVRPLFQ